MIVLLLLKFVWVVVVLVVGGVMIVVGLVMLVVNMRENSVIVSRKFVIGLVVMIVMCL